MKTGDSSLCGSICGIRIFATSTIFFSNALPRYNFLLVGSEHNRQNQLSVCLHLLLPILGHVKFIWKDIFNRKSTVDLIELGEIDL